MLGDLILFYWYSTLWKAAVFLFISSYDDI